TPKKKKNYNEDGELVNDWDLCDILVARAFGRQIENKDINQGKWPKGVLQFSNNIREQVTALRDHYRKKINPEIVPIVKEQYEKKINPIVYFLWPHSAQEWKAWILGFTSGMWSTVWRNEKEKIEFMKWMGQDLLNDKISEPMEEMLGRYWKMRNQKSVQSLSCILLIKWIPRSLKDPWTRLLDKEQTNLRDNSVYYMNCNFYNIFHFLNIHAASQNLIYWNVSASIFKAKNQWVPTASRTFK
uniref:Uncharacterized protein n=1 Tax=Romanomermis culicivorax TaxID=13658 RepID=A0A915KBI5_ROMCU